MDQDQVNQAAEGVQPQDVVGWGHWPDQQEDGPNTFEANANVVNVPMAIA